MGALEIMLTAFLLLPLFSAVDAFPAFYIRIPNGDKVPHVCPTDPSSTRWPAVGHWYSKAGQSLPRGTPTLNPFGRDFAASKFRWTFDLCQKDSDQDGKTNGEELGDPECKWSMTSHVPPALNATSHPGICEPINSERCAQFNSPLAAECPHLIQAKPVDESDPETEQMACPAINAPSVKKLELRLTGGAAEISLLGETHRDIIHFCQTFTLPAEEPYHIIALMPTTTTADSFFVSHMTIHACTDQIDSFNLAAIGGLNKPSKTACQLMKPCRKLVGTWKFNAQVKTPILCLPPLLGIRFGQGRFSKVVVDFYYAFKLNHPNASLPLVDVSSSGVSIYYTPKLRRHDLGVLLMGENYIRIPPGHPAWNVTVELPNTCLAKLATSQHTMTPIHASLHANRMLQSVQLWTLPVSAQESGTPLAETDREETQDQPYFDKKINNVLIRSIDGLGLRCVYDSEDNEAFTFYGPPPDGEMCYAAINFYPSNNNTWFVDATQMGQLSACQSTSTIINGCAIASFAQKYQEVIKNLRQACDSRTYPPVVCPTDCKTLIVREDLLGHDCLVGEVFQKIVRTPELLTTTVPFTPFEATSVASTIDLCRLEIYAIVIEKSGLKYQLNRTRIESDFGPPIKVETCRASGDFSVNLFLFIISFFIISWCL